MNIRFILLALLIGFTSPACAGSLTGTTPAATYKDLLHVPNSNSGVDGTLRNIEDGKGTSTPLRLSSGAVDINSGFKLGGTNVTTQGLDFLKGNGFYTTPTSGDTSQLLEDILSRRTYAAAFGVKCDGFQVLDISITNGCAIATSAQYDWPSSVVGMTFELTNNLETTTPITGTVLSRSGKTITLSTTWTGTTISSGVADGRLTLYSTDDAQNTQDALNYIRDRRKDEDSAALVGDTLVMPKGLCPVGNLVQPSRTIIEGQGHNATTLFLKAGSNSAVISSVNFATLSAGNLTYGNGVAAGTSNTVPTAFGLKDIQIEGNKAGNKTGTNSCVDYYGAQMVLLGDVEIGSCDYNSINWLGSTSYAYSTNDRWGAEEGRIDRLFLRNWTNYGFYSGGIHDTMVNQITGYSAQGSYGVYLQNIGSIHAGQIHIYATSDGRAVYLGAAASIQLLYCDFGGCVIDNGGVIVDSVRIISAGYQGINGLTLTSNSDYAVIGQVSCGGMYSSAPSGSICVDVQSGADAVRMDVTGSSAPAVANTTLLKWRGSFGKYSLTGGNYGATGGVCHDAGGTYNHWTQSTFGCKTAVSYTVGGNNDMTLEHFHSSGETDLNLVSGYIAQGDRFRFANATNSYEVIGGHLGSVGNAPTMGSCGTSPSITGTDTKGVITTGTGAPTACTLNFSIAYATAPVCVATTSDASSLPSVTTVSTSAVTFTLV